MRAMLLLNVVMYHCGVLHAPSLACCESTKTSNQSLAYSRALPAPRKTQTLQSSVSGNALLHVWLTNHVAGPT